MCDQRTSLIPFHTLKDSLWVSNVFRVFSSFGVAGEIWLLIVQVSIIPGDTEDTEDIAYPERTLKLND